MPNEALEIIAKWLELDEPTTITLQWLSARYGKKIGHITGHREVLELFENGTILASFRQHTCNTALLHINLADPELLPKLAKFYGKNLND